MPETSDGVIIRGDCLTGLRACDAGSADLVYMDPPFNTGRVQRGAAAAFNDTFDDLDAYLHFLHPRMAECLRVLTPDGSILVHCDWRTSHHLRLMLDDLLGPERFVNHLVWRYGLGGSSPRRFARKHDDILYYAKSNEYFFQPPAVPATSERLKGSMKKATDVLDIPAINNMAKERTGYPTQKPLALLKLLVEACCPRGGLVIDPFCGSGTTLVAARETGRRFLGFDISGEAIRIATQRVNSPREAPPRDRNDGRPSLRRSTSSS